jgi:hypothetical protein
VHEEGESSTITPLPVKPVATKPKPKANKPKFTKPPTKLTNMDAYFNYLQCKAGQTKDERDNDRELDAMLQQEMSILEEYKADANKIDSPMYIPVDWGCNESQITENESHTSFNEASSKTKGSRTLQRSCQAVWYQHQSCCGRRFSRLN